MSAWLIGLIVVAVGFAGVGAQVLSTQIHRFPTDVRRPGPLIHLSRTSPSSVHAPELRRLVTVISYAIIDDPSSKLELQQAFEDLDGPVSPLVEGPSSRRGHHRRSTQIDRAISALERELGLGEERAEP